MSNPYLNLQEAVAERLAEHENLAPIPMVTEAKGDIEKRVVDGITKGGLVKGSNNKLGLAILIYTPAARGRGNNRTLIKNGVLTRVALFVKPLLNDGPKGHQLAPLEATWNIQQQLLTWNRGPGQQDVEFDFFDSEEDRVKGEISYYNDFIVPLTLKLNT